eukprot:TRINITY_DN23620_c0_g1_i1.p1 TRINITY_DN23620_c0_g1~~TRINITY_DN23620_c0_g1_i1.p1  ORF type:complete len:419 (-),score=94.79 TRINITY_DN23620_c0_g1_i1:11-1267(-)
MLEDREEEEECMAALTAQLELLLGTSMAAGSSFDTAGSSSDTTGTEESNAEFAPLAMPGIAQKLPTAAMEADCTLSGSCAEDKVLNPRRHADRPTYAAGEFWLKQNAQRGNSGMTKLRARFKMAVMKKLPRMAARCPLDEEEAFACISELSLLSRHFRLLSRMRKTRRRRRNTWSYVASPSFLRTVTHTYTMPDEGRPDNDDRSRFRYAAKLFVEEAGILEVEECDRPPEESPAHYAQPPAVEVPATSLATEPDQRQRHLLLGNRIPDLGEAPTGDGTAKQLCIIHPTEGTANQTGCSQTPRSAKRPDFRADPVASSIGVMPLLSGSTTEETVSRVWGHNASSTGNTTAFTNGSSSLPKMDQSEELQAALSSARCSDGSSSSSTLLEMAQAELLQAAISAARRSAALRAGRGPGARRG